MKFATFLTAVASLGFGAARPTPGSRSPTPAKRPDVRWVPDTTYSKQPRTKAFWTEKACVALYKAGCAEGYIKQGAHKSIPHHNVQLSQNHVNVVGQLHDKPVHIHVFEDGSHALYEPKLPKWANHGPPSSSSHGWETAQMAHAPWGTTSHGVWVGPHFPAHGAWMGPPHIAPAHGENSHGAWLGPATQFPAHGAWMGPPHNGPAHGETSRGPRVEIPFPAHGARRETARNAQAHGKTSRGPRATLHFPAYGVRRVRDRQREFKKKARKAAKKAPKTQLHGQASLSAWEASPHSSEANPRSPQTSSSSWEGFPDLLEAGPSTTSKANHASRLGPNYPLYGISRVWRDRQRGAYKQKPGKLLVFSK